MQDRKFLNEHPNMNEHPTLLIKRASMKVPIFDLKVQDCIKIKETKEPEVILITPLPEPSKKTQTIKEEIKIPQIKISFEEADRNILLLALSTFIFTMFFVAAAIILYVSF